MRPITAFAALLLLAGCASNEYSSVPEPSGEWVRANAPTVAVPPGPVSGRMISASRERSR